MFLSLYNGPRGTGFPTYAYILANLSLRSILPFVYLSFSFRGSFSSSFAAMFPFFFFFALKGFRELTLLVTRGDYCFPLGYRAQASSLLDLRLLKGFLLFNVVTNVGDRNN